MTAAERSARNGRLGDEEALAGLPDGGGVLGSVASRNSNSGGVDAVGGGSFAGNVAAVDGTGSGGDSASLGAGNAAPRMRWW